MASETIAALLAQRAAETGTLEAIVGDDRRIDYATLNRRSAERAAWLVAQGVNKGHRVALLMPNGVEWAVNAYAVMRIGAVLTPLSTLLRAPELAAQLSIAGVRHLIAAPSHRGRNYREDIAQIERSKLPSLLNIWWAEDLGNTASADDQAIAAALTARLRPADDMAVIFSSGSRGQPKGVIHTHGAAIRAVAAATAARCIHGETRLYLPMPFFWVGGFATGLISALVAGATLLTEATPEPAATLQFLARERATLFRGWPDQAAQIAKHPDFARTDLSSLSAGSLDALLPPTLRSQPGRRANIFGMTETFGPYCGFALDTDMPADKFGSCGKPFEGMQVRIVDADTGRVLPAGETGNIQIGGRNLMRGICGREREAVFTPDGWYDTGDVGRLDADGFMFYTGRRDDMLKVKGATVYPSEVEAALLTIPGVERAFVTGIVVNGAAAIGAAVITGAALTIEQIAAAARPRLSAFKVPSRWLVFGAVEQLPHSSTGKVDTAALQRLLTQATVTT